MIIKDGENKGAFLKFYADTLDVADIIHAERRPNFGAVLAWDPVDMRGIFTAGYHNKRQKEEADIKVRIEINNYFNRKRFVFLTGGLN